ncbi:hypothetical protein B0G75_1164 [Paraburkholderia sp. BL18I3N2]|nr:hypothetical protein B0G75_1164 [Paraburkholderia sp. BL18I3N2]
MLTNSSRNGAPSAAMPQISREAAFGGIVAGAIVLALVSWRGVTPASLSPAHRPR